MDKNSFDLKINSELFKYLKMMTLNIDELFCVICYHLKYYDLLDEYVDSKLNGTSHLWIIRQLEMKQIISKFGRLSEFKDYELTAKYEQFCKDLMNKTDLVTLNHKVDVTDNNGVLALSQKIYEIFPSGIRNGGNMLIRSSVAEIRNKLVLFLKKFDYDATTIETATLNYIAKFKFKGDYKFCTAAKYFILKDGNSSLADECSEVIESKKRGENSSEEFDDFTHQLM